MRRGIDTYGQNDLDIYNRYLEKYIGKAPVVWRLMYTGGGPAVVEELFWRRDQGYRD